MDRNATPQTSSTNLLSHYTTVQVSDAGPPSGTSTGVISVQLPDAFFTNVNVQEGTPSEGSVPASIGDDKLGR